MAFEALFDATNATPFKFEEIGTILEAYYMGSFDYEGDYGPTKKHIFKTAADEPLVVFGQKNLMQQLPTAQVGAMLRVTYTGDKPAAKKGQHPMKLFKIEQDRKNTTDVVSVKTETAPIEDDTGYANPSDDADEVEDTVIDEPVLPRAAAPRVPGKLPSQASQDKVRELLARGKARTA